MSPYSLVTRVVPACGPVSEGHSPVSGLGEGAERCLLLFWGLQPCTNLHNTGCTSAPTQLTYQALWGSAQALQLSMTGLDVSHSHLC